MNRNDGLSLWRDSFLNQIFVNIQCIWTDINEYDRGPVEHKSIGGRHERIGGHDHLVPRLNVTEQCGHLSGMRAGCGKERL